MFTVNLLDECVTREELKYLGNKTEINHHVNFILKGRTTDTWDSFWRYVALKKD